MSKLMGFVGPCTNKRRRLLRFAAPDVMAAPELRLTLPSTCTIVFSVGARLSSSGAASRVSGTPPRSYWSRAASDIDKLRNT